MEKEYSSKIDSLRQYHNTGVTLPIAWRKQQLRQLKRLVLENEGAFFDALAKDLGKPIVESWTSEVSLVVKKADYYFKHVERFAKPRKVKTPLAGQPGKCIVKPEPLGVVVVMGAWNYPLQLILSPLAAVISAGNCAVLKPSELTPTCSQLLAELIPKYMDQQAFIVIEGGVEETTVLLAQKVEHIFYTGNGRVARIVMAAAAKHLTPVTLELGGKSPVYVDESCDLKITARRLAWGKFTNAGQICVAPDYILTTQRMRDRLVAAIKDEVRAMFGSDPKQSDSYGRIVNQSHVTRLLGYLEGANIVPGGGQHDIKQRYVSPTIVLDPKLDSLLMQEEIFGPILPIITVDGFDDAVKFVRERDKPLAAYLFSKNKQQQQRWTDEISSGSQCINDVFMFSIVPELPFGGVGPSGMGQMHGRFGFERFSHMKAVMQRANIADPSIRFAPYTKNKLKWLKMVS
jgi:aldehyde dehydrogenase (NAD+)